MLMGVEYVLGHMDTSRVVHLTLASFLVDALCGAVVELDGEPELPVICEDCDRLAREAGGDPDGWVRTHVENRLELRAAA